MTTLQDAIQNQIEDEKAPPPGSRPVRRMIAFQPVTPDSYMADLALGMTKNDIASRDLASKGLSHTLGPGVAAPSHTDNILEDQDMATQVGHDEADKQKRFQTFGVKGTAESPDAAAPADLHFNTPYAPPQQSAGATGDHSPAFIGNYGAGRPGGGGGTAEASTVSPEREAALNENYDQAGHLAAHQAYAESAAEGAKAEGFDTMANATADAANQLDADARHRRGDAEMDDAYQQKALDHLLHQPGIDQDRLWNSMSTAAQVGTTIAAGLAGFGMGWNHEQGPNPVVASLKERIQNDIHAQEEDFRRKDAGWEKKSQLFAHAYAVTGDYNQARKLAFDMGLQSVANRVKAIDHSSAQPVIKAHGAQLYNEIERDKIEEGIKRHPMVSTGHGGVSPEQEAKVRFEVMKEWPKGVPMSPKAVQEQVNLALYGYDPGHDVAPMGSAKGQDAKGAAQAAYAATVDKEGQGLVLRPDAGSTNWKAISTWFQDTPETEVENVNKAHDLKILEVVKNNLGGRATPDQIKENATPFFMSREFTGMAPSADRMIQSAQLFHKYQLEHANMPSSDDAGGGDVPAAFEAN